ncbi:Na+/H+ antiporter subunit B [Pseudoruegeria sp. SK021]|uniref:Na+/H+ antiporter subunit B n=1 Tax=Pseudoruegeria sp. SK021 TaxID=1933035 RepID=UPI000A235F4D|nr:Na+/H+ antiporter subunit B [Pseudoruegeria sp. SK021]OSP56822.1 Na(+)/H(+) antiporter subunit B [Pseudoruegeria sp. SK021]
MNSVILNAATRILVPLLLVFSLFMTLRGHNDPGGGFIGGLIGSTAFIFYAIAFSTAEARSALRIEPEQLAIIGLGLALLAGLVSIVFNEALFTGQWLFLGASEGEKGLPISSVLLFDIGVYLVVMGGILALVFALEEEV